MLLLTDVDIIDYSYMRISHMSCYLKVSLQDYIQQILKKGKLWKEVQCKTYCSIKPLHWIARFHHFLHTVQSAHSVHFKQLTLPHLMLFLRRKGKEKLIKSILYLHFLWLLQDLTHVPSHWNINTGCNMPHNEDASLLFLILFRMPRDRCISSTCAGCAACHQTASAQCGFSSLKHLFWFLFWNVSFSVYVNHHYKLTGAWS